MAPGFWRTFVIRKRADTFWFNRFSMGGSAMIGLRPPQFSEDAAWLPIWLQQQNVEEEPFDEGINIGETPFEQHVKELQFLEQEMSKEGNANVSTTGEGCYKSCHLLLSGDESSPLCFAPSTDNVVDFHLHLSSDANSKCLPSALGDSSWVQRVASNRSLLKQPLGPSVVPEGKINHSNVECDTSSVKGSPNSRPCYGSHMMRHEENVGFCQVDDISEAVELSIAASEALVIHEIMTELVTKPLPASAVLEAAIQVKQARLDIWKETLRCSSVHIGETDFLSDLDDLIMEDACEHVGQPRVDPPRHENDNLSQVKGTFDSLHDGHAGNFKQEDNNTDFGKSLDDFQKRMEDEALPDEMKVENVSASEISCGNRHEELPYDSAVCLGSISKHYSTSPPVHCSEQEYLQGSASLEVVDYGVREDDIFQAHAQSSLARTFEVSEKYNSAIYFLPQRFESRWFGGWTWKKDEKSFAQMEHQKIQGIPKPFVGETSYLSESADVAPDENSVLQKQCKELTVSSQSSISEVHCKKADKEILLSQDVISCSNLSLSDPLCSVVACSFVSENICSTAILKDEGDITRNCSIPKPEYTTDNMQKTSTVVDLVHAERYVVPLACSELLPAVRHQLTSLRPYSVMFANPGASLLKKNSCRRTFPLQTMPESSMRENPFSNLTDLKNFNDAVENDVFTTILGKYQKTSTPILDHRQEKSAVLGTSEGLLLDKEPHKVQSNCENQNSTRVPARKCVRFVEAGTNNPPEKKLSQQRAALKNCNTSRATKRLRTTNRRSESGALELKRRQSNCFNKNGKRLLFQNMDFLLTGFSNEKEKQYEGLIRKYGGTVLSDIPSPNSRGNRSSRFSPHMLPIVLSLKKLQTIKFLYGCAVNAFVLKAEWLTDSIVAGSILHPQPYSILPKKPGGSSARIRKPFSYNFGEPIFDNLGIMLHGKNNFCIEMAKVIKHGGGKVFKTLQCLVDNVDTKKISVGVIVAENESRASRHLKQCALECRISTMSSYWIIKSLHIGKLLPFNGKKNFSRLTTLKLPNVLASMQLSEEI